MFLTFESTIGDRVVCSFLLDFIVYSLCTGTRVDLGGTTSVPLNIHIPQLD